jgi:RNA polymerase sigma-70 factor (ECF subfamily)
MVHSPRREHPLLESLVRGDREAFWELWQMHEPHIADVCRRRMSSAPTDADDAMSRSMFVAFEKMPEYAASIINVEAWLTRLCCNVCTDVLRERCHASRGGAISVEAASGEPALASNDSPEENCMSRELGRLIARAIDELRPSLRDAARLRFIDEASYPEIAKRLRITPANARKRVQQSRSILRQRLGITIGPIIPDQSRPSADRRERHR